VNASVDEILLGFLLVDSKVQGQLVNVEKIVLEAEQNLQAYSQLSTVLSDPKGIDRLIGELAESCSFYIWWNEREQFVDMQAIKPISSIDVFWSDEDNIISAIEAEERPKERVSTLSFYSNPRDFAGDMNDPNNFKTQNIIATSTNNGPDQFAELPQLREVFTRWLTTDAQVAQTGSRYVNRYSDIPKYLKFTVDAKDGGVWTGKYVRLSTDEIVDDFGARVLRRWLVIQADEPDAGHSQRVELADVTLDGRIFTITPDGQGGYTAEAFEEGLAFITDNEGLNPDGTAGATIA
jgi:hypothetical protein